MRDKDRGVLRRAKLVHALCHYAQGIDVQSGISLIENRETRCEYRHLKNLVPLFLTARETLVHRARKHCLVHVDQLQLLFNEIKKLERIDLLHAICLPDLVVGGAQEIRVGYARNLDWVLKGEKNPILSSHFRI